MESTSTHRVAGKNRLTVPVGQFRLRRWVQILCNPYDYFAVSIKYRNKTITPENPVSPSPVWILKLCFLKGERFALVLIGTAASWSRVWVERTASSLSNFPSAALNSFNIGWNRVLLFVYSIGSSTMGKINHFWITKIFEHLVLVSSKYIFSLNDFLMWPFQFLDTNLTIVSFFTNIRPLCILELHQQNLNSIKALNDNVF